MLAVRAKALIDGRLAPSVDDVVSLAEPVLKHRMALTFAARAEGESATGVINRLAAASGVGRRVAASGSAAAYGKGSASVFKLEGEAQALADRLPDLLLEALRVANTVVHGIHGRRRAGTGETFWQFRQFQGSDPATVIDWRRSASSDTLYVREREWEASHTFWLWPDVSPSMLFKSHLAPVSKRDRALVLTLAIAEMLVRAGERVALLGLTPPMASRRAASRIARSLAASEDTEAAEGEPAAEGAPFALLERHSRSATSSIRPR